MAAQRPPNAPSVPETIDDADVIDDADIVEIDETAPPQRSPIGRPLPFGANPGGALPPQGATPGHTPAAGQPLFGQPGSAQAPSPVVRQAPFGEETAPAQRSPLAAALPFRHAKVAPSTVAIPMPTDEDLRRLAQGGPDPSAAAAAARPAGAPAPDAAARAKLEQAKTVAFAMPPPMDSPSAQTPHRAAPPQYPQYPQYPPQTPAPQAHGPQGYPPHTPAPQPPPSQPHAPQGYPPHPSAPPPPPSQPHAAHAPAPQPPPSQPRAPQAHSAPPSQPPLQAPAHASPVPAGGGPVAAMSTGHFGLSIEQYAALCAELAVFPQAAETIFAQYGLASRKDRLTADLAWQERLRADNALMQRWQSLYLHYHEYYHRQGRR
jgi:hypothetical protein